MHIYIYIYKWVCVYMGNIYITMCIVYTLYIHYSESTIIQRLILHIIITYLIIYINICTIVHSLLICSTLYHTYYSIYVKNV